MALGPVILGTALGYARSGTFDGFAAWLALAAAVLMQVITNLQNDVGYTERGAEKDGLRIGLPRATALGWLDANQVHWAILILSLVATSVGVALVAYRGWTVLAIGALSLLAALAYMGGPKPIAYTPWGEVTAFVFFGPVAVLGTDWLVTGAWVKGAGGFSLQAVNVLASLCAGSLTAAALALNNHRDQAHDRTVGRRTFAVCWGEAASGRLFLTLLVGPFAVALLLALIASVWFMTLGLLMPVAIVLARDFRRCKPGAAYNLVLLRTFRLSLWFSALMSLASLMTRWVT